jgi:hypothetical protein
MPEPLRDVDRAKERMLPVLLAEVRRVRRRRRVRAVAGVAFMVLLAGVSAIVWRPTPSPQALIAERERRDAGSAVGSAVRHPDPPSLAANTPRVRVESSTSTPRVRVEVVTSGSGRELFAADASPTVRVEWINTDQAYALLESAGQRYGIVEYAGRVEFVQLAAK